MKTVWKYVLDDANEQIVRQFGSSIVEAPEGAKFLCMERQRNTAVMYLEVDTDAKKRLYRIYNVGTGNPIKYPTEDMDYIGSVVLTRKDRADDDNSVHHFYRMHERAEAVMMAIKEGLSPSEGAVAIEFPIWAAANTVH